MQPDNKKSHEYDGIYFLPYQNEEEGEEGLVISYFDFKEDMANGTPIEGTAVGPKYHIAFFKRGPDGSPEFDETFEAIIGDPGKYINNLTGAGVYGCVVKKTNKSQKWFDDYLTRTLGHITMKKMVNCLKSVLETK